MEEKLKYILTILKQQDSNRKELVVHLNNIYSDIAKIKEHEHQVKNELHLYNIQLNEHMNRTKIMEERFELEKQFNHTAREELMKLINDTSKNLDNLSIKISTSVKAMSGIVAFILSIVAAIKIFF